MRSITTRTLVNKFLAPNRTLSSMYVLKIYTTDIGYIQGMGQSTAGSRHIRVAHGPSLVSLSCALITASFVCPHRRGDTMIGLGRSAGPRDRNQNDDLGGVIHVGRLHFEFHNLTLLIRTSFRNILILLSQLESQSTRAARDPPD